MTKAKGPVQVIGIDHLVIRVGDLDRSRRFYDKVLGFMGFEREWEFGKTVGWNNGVTMFWIAEAEDEAKDRLHRRGDIGYHHYAFEVDSREEVDALHAFLKAEKVEIADPPAAYPSYGEGYYAVFFQDPDGLKLEAMVFLEKQKRRALRRR